MTQDQPVPSLWLLSDARNDAVLEEAIKRLPEGSGFVFRHYHLASEARAARFAALLPLLREADHWAIVSNDCSISEEWGADGVYGMLNQPPAANLRWIATAHNTAEIEKANRFGADAVMLSPVFPTRSHPGACTLGAERFHELAALSRAPVIALGGMNAERARELDWPRWAAIDGLS